MKRKNALITITTLVGSLGALSAVRATAAGLSTGATVASVPKLGKPLHPPAKGPVRVGVIIGPDLVAIDAFGPIAAFGDALIAPNVMDPPLFDIYTVAETTEAIDFGGLKLQSQYSFKNAPQPHVLFVPMQKSLPATIAYLKKASVLADVTMSVCTGAFLVAKAGLFDGLKATTHHGGYDAFEKWYPKVTLIRGV